MRFSGEKNRKYTVRSDIAATASWSSGSSSGHDRSDVHLRPVLQLERAGLESGRLPPTVTVPDYRYGACGPARRNLAVAGAAAAAVVRRLRPLGSGSTSYLGRQLPQRLHLLLTPLRGSASLTAGSPSVRPAPPAGAARRHRLAHHTSRSSRATSARRRSRGSSSPLTLLPYRRSPTGSGARCCWPRLGSRGTSQRPAAVVRASSSWSAAVGWLPVDLRPPARAAGAAGRGGRGRLLRAAAREAGHRGRRCRSACWCSSRSSRSWCRRPCW